MWGVTLATPPGTAAGHATVITDAPVTRIVGPHNDGADFYGLALGLLAIVVAITLTRLVFRRRGGSPGAEGTR
jgi:hypothetical protein